MVTSNSNSRQTELGQCILEEIDRRGSIAGDLLFMRVEAEFGDIGGREYSAVMDNLRELGMVESFDGGYDVIHEITRDGVARLAE